MAVAKDKRRVTISLNAANLDRFHALCEEIGLPNSTLSAACDDVLKTLTAQWEVVAEKKRSGGTYGLKDLASLVCQQLGLLFEDKKEAGNVSKQKSHFVLNTKMPR